MKNAILTTALLLALAACNGEDATEAGEADATATETAAGDGPAADAAAPGGKSSGEEATEAAATGDAAPGKADGATQTEVDFGDDSSQWANDGECDDPRFEGPGMTTTPLLDSDIRHDATDCREAFERGDLTLR
ncbi:MAG: hypothetical protein JY451_11620 [Erythrobacter sp.]|nr:MAG: hypothetical protein JY451_11620 [Erythrobacter sp.]